MKKRLGFSKKLKHAKIFGVLHKPHPGNIVKEYAMKQVLEELREVGYIK